MKIVFIGCVQFSFDVLEHLLRNFHSPASGVEIVGVISKLKSDFNSDFRSLEPLAHAHNLPFLSVEKNEDDLSLTWLKKIKPDVIYCFGWSSLLSPEVLRSAPLGVIGFHPAALPQNRGRHPLIWALALGLKTTASTFFVMDEEADSGPLLSQKSLAISDDDDAQTLYAKVTALALQQISEFTPKLAAKTHTLAPQDAGRSSYWRKRGKNDGLVDWRMAGESIKNLVRALSPPYPGAHFKFFEGERKLLKVELVREVSSFSPNDEPGKILAVDGLRLLVKCGDGALWLTEHNLTLAEVSLAHESRYLFS